MHDLAVLPASLLTNDLSKLTGRMSWLTVKMVKKGEYRVYAMRMRWVSGLQMSEVSLDYAVALAVAS